MAGKFTAQEAIAAVRAAGAEPLQPYPNNMAKKWACRCLSCGAKIFPRMGSIARGSKACCHCHGPNPVDPEKAKEAMLAAGVEPLEPYPGYDHPWRVRCLNCGRESTPLYSSIAKGQGACYRCGKDYGELPAHVYLVHDEERGVVKIGITNAHAHRMSKYKNWEVVEMLKINTGNEAARIEAEVLRCWRLEMGLKAKLIQNQMPDKGYTETADDVGLTAALEILRKHKNSENK